MGKTNRVKRSVPLPDTLKEKLNVVIGGFGTIEDAAEYFDVHRDTLIRIASNGSGNSINVNRIVKKLQVA